MPEQKPLPGSSEWMRRLEKEEEAIETRKKNRRPRIDEHLNLDATDTLDRGRKARHPAGHERIGAPKGSLTSGKNREAKDPGR